MDEYYDLVSDLMKREEFDLRIEKYSAKYSGLLEEVVLAHLLVDELGRNVSNYLNITELKPGSKASIYVIVTTPEPKVFPVKKDNRFGAEIHISDPSGRAKLILWDAQWVEQVQNQGLKPGTKLKIVNAKISKSRYGVELTLDRFESLIIDPADFPQWDDDYADGIDGLKDISLVDTDGPVSILGTIAEISELRAFKRKNSTTGHVLNLKLYDGTGSIRITLWDDAAVNATNYLIGDQIKIINGNSKLHNSVREIQSNYQTQIIKMDNN